MASAIQVLIALLSAISVSIFFFSGSYVGDSLSPQGCRMSYMSPSYLLQSAFDSSWTPLGRRYSLWLYREVPWENHELHGSPVLFIPGNAGSSHQIRSIASSATRQYFVTPHEIAPTFRSRSLKPLDFFAVEYNEDLSAFHGPIIDAETAYARRAIDYILSLYPENTTVTILAHSMGGVVASALLPHPRIATIITMSTPHTLPPVRFDRRVDRIYDQNRIHVAGDPTPIVSLCGGATDLMVPAESCILQENDKVFRRTLFTSALEGSWTGVGHREMVWCHQVRWRVARAVLELGAASDPEARGAILDIWLRDGHSLPPKALEQSGSLELHPSEMETLPAGMHLVLKKPQGSRTYLLPALDTSISRLKFMLYVSGGSIPPVAPQNAESSLSVCVFICQMQDVCEALAPTTLKLIPNPVPGKPFPIPGEGVNESEGVVLFEADITFDRGTRVAIQIHGGNGRGWVVGGIVRDHSTQVGTGLLGPFISNVHVPLLPHVLYSQVRLPHLISNALIVYRVTPRVLFPASCIDALLPPLLLHTSYSVESHFYPLSTYLPNHPILLHTHVVAPYIHRSPDALERGFDVTVYSTGECGVEGLDIRVHWWSTLGRWGVRYWSAVASWAVGVVAILFFQAWGIADTGGSMPSVDQLLSHFIRCTLPLLLPASLLISFVPLPENYFLGNRGQPLFVGLAPILLLIVTGLVCISWWVVSALMWPLTWLSRLIGRRREDTAVRRNVLVSMGVIFMLIFLVVPWQVAFLGCWILHLYTCVTYTAAPSTPTPSSPSSIPLTPRGNNNTENDAMPSPKRDYAVENANHNALLLLLMTWLLPFAAPVLAVWIRTLATAGLSTPFDGDHNFLYVVPFLALVDLASFTRGPIFNFPHRSSGTALSRWALLILAATVFFVAPRKTYVVFDAASGVMSVIVALRIGPRYWGGNY